MIFSYFLYIISSFKSVRICSPRDDESDEPWSKESPLVTFDTIFIILRKTNSTFYHSFNPHFFIYNFCIISL
jgi:hypothetical protein